VDEAGAVDTAFGHAAPEIGRSEQGFRVLERLCGAWLEPTGIDLPAESLLWQPPQIVVGGADAGPAVAGLEDDQRLARQSLAHLLGAVVGGGAKGTRVAHERMFA
jgi:hypothetical protein